MARNKQGGRGAMAALLAVAALIATMLMPASASASPAYLMPGQTLSGGGAIFTGQFRMVMQSDGNLVVYNQAGRPLWASRTSCVCFLRMQYDGNLVIYKRLLPGGAVWSTRTAGQNGARLVLQDDGNLVLMRGSTPVWASGTVYSKLFAPDYLSRGHNLFSPNGVYQFAMQRDGNAVLYNRQTRRAIWASNTMGSGYRFAMQRDGNLVIYSYPGHPVWTSGTAGNPGAYLNLQSDGNLVLYVGSRPVWATNTQNR